MKNKIAVLLLILSSVVLVFGLPGKSMAVEINIGIAPPPPVALPAPPPVILVPGTYVYYVPDVQAEILFYHGWWWRPFRGRWFRARHYNGPWVFVPRPPRPLVALPRGFRRMRGPIIPHADLKRNWQLWERNRYWDSHHEWPERGRGEGREEHRGHERD